MVPGQILPACKTPSSRTRKPCVEIISPRCCIILAPFNLARANVSSLSSVRKSKLEDAKQSIETYRKPKSIGDALEAMRKFWDAYLDVLQVETPDPALNSTVNIHNPHQCHTTRQWSRYLSYYQLGLGARGIGMRDSSQDILGTMANNPQDAKNFLKMLLSFQKQNGSAFHSFNPLTLEGSVGDAAEMEDRPHYYSDDHLWSVLVRDGIYQGNR